jgi:exopolysaccharide biosynthesis protein
MKVLITVILGIVLGGVLFFVRNAPITPIIEVPTSPTPTIATEDTKQLTIDSYTYSYYIVPSTSTASLYSNIPYMLSTTEIQKDKSCTVLINSGFYTDEGKHIGLYQTDYTELPQIRASQLFDGYVGIEGNIFTISNLESGAPTQFQTGPLLMTNSRPRALSIKNDEFARRMILATTNTNTAILITIYDQSVKTRGPLLAELPNLIKRISDSQDWNILSAINLDGGTHSAFITPNSTLREIAPIGGYICINDINSQTIP